MRLACALKAPAGRAVWLGRAQGEDSRGSDFVHFPRGRSCAWRAVLGVKSAVAHGWLPSRGCEHAGDALEPGFIGHLRRLAFNDQVKVVRGDRDNAVGIVREVLCFTGCLLLFELISDIGNSPYQSKWLSLPTGFYLGV